MEKTAARSVKRSETRELSPLPADIIYSQRHFFAQLVKRASLRFHTLLSTRRESKLVANFAYRNGRFEPHPYPFRMGVTRRIVIIVLDKLVILIADTYSVNQFYVFLHINQKNMLICLSFWRGAMKNHSFEAVLKKEKAQAFRFHPQEIDPQPKHKLP